MDDLAQRFRHVVVLMFENRSFDHIFGAFPGADGLFEADGNTLKAGIYNLTDPTSPEGPSNPRQLPLAITPDTQPTADAFDHNFGTGMMHELFGPGTTGWQDGGPIAAPASTAPKTNCGFYQTAKEMQPQADGREALSYFENGSLKALHQLAAHFVLCDNWFCDIPADTLLNRYFMHTAQTDGDLSPQQWGGIYTPSSTIFDSIEVKQKTWKIYAPWAQQGSTVFENTQIDSRFLNPHIQGSDNAHHPVDEFARDAQARNLPFYSFLMCWMPQQAIVQAPDTSMHPVSDIRAGENYLAAVYRALRASGSWRDTLLIVTFDESGGLYDHVFPPAVAAPNDLVGTTTDDIPGKTCTFDFTLLGPRVPAILVSPWLRSGIAKGQYQNTSILKLLNDAMGSPPLNRRDAAAPSLDAIFAEFGLEAPRPDCPTEFDTWPGLPYADGDLFKRYEVPSDAPIRPPSYLPELVKLYGKA